MLGLGFATTNVVLSRRTFLMGAAALPSLLLVGLGDQGVTEGFSGHSSVTGYTATADRFRLAPTGFVRCAADEERLCFNTDGSFRGQYMQGADTYFSAPWDDADAPNTSGDPAYLTGTVAYAGEHSEADIFGGTGGGVVITHASQNQFHTASNAAATGVQVGDVIRYHAIIAIDSMTVAGQVDIRGTNPGFAFSFAHDANGDITGLITGAGSTSTYQADYYDMGTINGKRWYYLWVDRLATSTSNAAIGIGFGNITADVGKKYHVCELMTQKNPQTAPAAVPVCAAAKTFAADTLVTTFNGTTIGALFQGGVARCRSRISDGNLSLGADTYVSSEGEPLVTSIGIVPSTETVDRVGILPNRMQEHDFRKWGNPAALNLILGPGRFQTDILASFGVATFSTASITSAFKNNIMQMAWVDGRVITDAQLQGNLTLDDVIIAPTTSTLADQFEQTDFSFSFLHDVLSFPGSAISAQRSLFMSHICTHSRARFQAQFDDDPVNGSAVWMGGIRLSQTNAAGMSLTLDDSSFQCIGRGPSITASGAGADTRVHTWSARRVYADRLWSDFTTASSGIASGTFEDVFMGRTTGDSRLALYQTRKEIQVDVGSGWQDLSVTALTEDDLPIGQQAEHIGVWDFVGETLDTGAATGENAIVRSWNRGSSAATDTPGFQFHLTARDIVGAGGLEYSRSWDAGDTFQITQSSPPSATTPHVRFTADLGSYSGATFNITANPALLASGTHADFFQPPATNGSVQNMTFDGIMILDKSAQGLFMQGGGTGGVATYANVTIDEYVQVTATSNAISISQVAGTPTFDIDNVLVLPSNPTNRFADGTPGGQALIRGSGSNVTLDFNNVWNGRTVAPSPELGATFNGTVDLIEPPSITNFDTVVQATTTPNVSQMVPAAYTNLVTGHIDVETIIPLEDDDFAFTSYAESLTGIALNDLLARTTATGRTFKPFVDLYLGDGSTTGWARDPDFFAGVDAATATVGDTLDLRQFVRFVPEAELSAGTLTSSEWLAKYGDGGANYFEFDGAGGLRVARDLTGLDRLFLLMTAANEMILVDVGDNAAPAPTPSPTPTPTPTPTPGSQFPASAWTVASDWTITDTPAGLELTRGSGSASLGCIVTFPVTIGTDYLINFTGGAGLASAFSNAASIAAGVRSGAQSLAFKATTDTLQLAFWGNPGVPTAIDGLEVIEA